MAVPSLDKENAPPPSAARGIGIAVKRQTMKRPRGGGSKQVPRRRPPLRDITRLFVTAAPCPPPPPSTAVLLARSDAAALPEAVRLGAGGASDGVTVKRGSYSLRMGFR